MTDEQSEDPFGTEFPDPTVVRRAKDGRPYIKSPCPDAQQADGGNGCHQGRVPGKRPNTTKQCPKCKGQGHIEKLYTRCTTFVGALEERTQLEAWRQRVILTGLADSPELLAELGSLDIAVLDAAFAAGDDPFAESGRQILARIAERAFVVGEGHAAAQRGTDIHKLTEYVDRGEPLPELIRQEVGPPREVTLQDRADVAAWQRFKDDFGVVVLESELFVVNDDFGVGGTLDRLATLTPEQSWNLCTLCDRPKIVDIKTGRVDYGAGKMAQQLAIYANSKRYDPETGARAELGACPHIGIIFNLKQGTGEGQAYVIDLEKGYAAVELSRQVREHRSVSKKWIEPLKNTSPDRLTSSP